MKKVIAVLLFMIGLAVGASAQTTTRTVTAQPYLCINQTSFYCYNMPITLDDGAGHVSTGSATIDIFSYSYGYVTVSGGGSYFSGPITAVQIVSLDQNGRPTEIKVGFQGQGDPDNDGDTDTMSGLLDLTVQWIAQSSGGGRGTHNVIWRPKVSMSGTSSTVSMD
jgi:hypothetical protein